MRRSISFLLTAAFALLATAFVGTASAQRLDGTLRVTVTDGSQASIEEAKVTVTNDGSGVSGETTASSAGTYVFPSLLSGTYTVTVEKSGFKKSIQKNIVVNSNQVTESSIVLELGSVSAIVEVEAGADLVQTQSSEITTSFDGKVVNNLPLNTLGGDVKEFAVFVPGTTTQQGGVLGSGGSVGGTRPRFNGFNIDGVDDNRIDVSGPVQPVIQESVAEFTLLTNQFSAEYGHSAGGIFNIITKSGTNSWHGAAWENNRNRNYNAADNLQKARIESGQASDLDRFDYNRFGGSLGGPIKHDKLFIYGAYEFQNEGLASSGASVTMPTSAGLAQLQAMNPNPAVSDILGAVSARADFKRTGPLQHGSQAIRSLPSLASTARQSTSARSSPSRRLIPISTTSPSTADANLGKHQLRGRFLYDRLRLPQVNPVQPQAQFTGAQAADARKVLFTDAWSISPRWINDFRASYSRLNGPNLTVPASFLKFPERGNRRIRQQRRPVQPLASGLRAEHLPGFGQPHLRSRQAHPQVRLGIPQVHRADQRPAPCSWRMGLRDSG